MGIVWEMEWKTILRARIASVRSLPPRAMPLAIIVTSDLPNDKDCWRFGRMTDDGKHCQSNHEMTVTLQNATAGWTRQHCSCSHQELIDVLMHEGKVGMRIGVVGLLSLRISVSVDVFVLWYVKCEIGYRKDDIERGNGMIKECSKCCNGWRCR